MLVHDGTPGALSAMTAWRVLSTAGEVSLLAVSARTGRMHQVRAHLAAAGHPLIGDPLYDGPTSVDTGGGEVALEHPFLHARALALPHPDGGRLSVEAPLPEGRRAILEQLGLSISPLP